jgi:FkbM family methyltransferase
MLGLGAAVLCDRVNARLADLTYTYGADEHGHRLAVAGRPPVRFPHSAGGQVHGGSSSWVEKKHAGGQIHEPGLVATLLALAELRSDVRTFLDVGALYGYVSLVARSMFPDCEAHAFEVNPNSYRALNNNFDANRDAFGDSVVAHHCALSDESARQVRLRVHRFQVQPAGAGEGGKGREHDIDVWSFDDFCAEHGLRPDVIKMDVEGYQAKIVPGAMGVIARDRPVILLEFDAPGAANAFGVTNRDVIAPLLDDGYRLVWGRHRRPDGRFQVLEAADLTDRHEVNSLGILVP